MLIFRKQDKKYQLRFLKKDNSRQKKLEKSNFG